MKTKQKANSGKTLKIIKRDGTLSKFEPEKITNAILKAAYALGGNDKQTAEELSRIVVNKIKAKYTKNNPSVEDIQDEIEEVLIKEGHAKTAKAFILYRFERNQERARRAIILGHGNEGKYLNFSTNALQILEKRYLRKDTTGKLLETPEGMLRRVSKAISSAERKFKSDAKQAEKEFYEVMSNLDFLPNSPALMNAGTENEQMASCFVLPVPDSLDGIFNTLRDTAKIHQSGGGTGFSFSKLRAKNDIVKSTNGVAAGPIAFMKVFDSTTEIIKQGGRRKGANMAVLRVDHPDIIEFITVKNDRKTLLNFNISVAATDEFMNAVINNSTYTIKHPKTKEVLRKIKARAVFNLLVQNTWKNADPGILFIDRINKMHPLTQGEIESTSPCGEQPLLPYESVAHGSINLRNMIRNDWKDIDYDKLRKTVRTAVRFLDNLIEVNKYPLPEIAHKSKQTRKIGVGIMGFADLLFMLEIKYDSKEAVKLAEKIMKFIYDEAKIKSEELAVERGAFPDFSKSNYKTKIRNACLTTIAPTGTISMLADTTGGCEPAYAISYSRFMNEGTELLYTNKIFEKKAIEHGFYNTDLMKKVARFGNLNFEEVPKKIREVFVVSHNVNPEWHVKIQAAFQKHVDGSISKTINFPSTATVEDVEKALIQAYKLGVKGITTYVDRSHELQVLHMGGSEEKLAQSSSTINRTMEEIRSKLK